MKEHLIIEEISANEFKVTADEGYLIKVTPASGDPIYVKESYFTLKCLDRIEAVEEELPAPPDLSSMPEDLKKEYLRVRDKVLKDI